jgi:hypothetical protein
LLLFGPRDSRQDSSTGYFDFGCVSRSAWVVSAPPSIGLIIDYLHDLQFRSTRRIFKGDTLAQACLP